MTNFPGPPSWQASTQYTQNVSEVSNANFYYIATVSGTSGNSNPFTAVAAASVFNSPITDGTVTWVAAQRSRKSWVANAAYTAGLPLATSASVTTLKGELHTVPNSQFVPIGAYVVTTVFVGLSPPYFQVNGVTTSASTVTINALSSGTGTGHPVLFNQAPGGYPYPDQIVTGGSGSPVAQCIITGVSGSVQPVWSAVLGASVTDGSAAWATVAIN